SRQPKPDALVVRIYAEALRVLRRAPHAELMLGSEASEQEAFSWQMSRLSALEPALSEYLRDVPGLLGRALAKTDTSEQAEILLALTDLRAEAADVLLPLLTRPNYPHAELAVDALAWSRDTRVGPWLRDWAILRVPMARRARQR